jgi:hypothetical protein
MKDAAKQRYGWDLGISELRAGIKALGRERVKPNFGNAGLYRKDLHRKSAANGGLCPVHGVSRQALPGCHPACV